MTLNQKLMAWMMARAAGSYETAIAPRKTQLFADISGTVLEIGPGAGPNLRYFCDRQVQWTGLEPNPYMLPYLQQQADTLGLSIEVQQSTLDELDDQSNCFDYVVSTLVLCSVPNLTRAIQQIHTLLKPGGKFLFVEHVAAPGGSLLRQVQNGIRPFWSWIGEGCQSNRQTGAVIESAGFTSVTYDAFDGPIPIPVVRPHICGVAVK